MSMEHVWMGRFGKDSMRTEGWMGADGSLDRGRATWAVLYCALVQCQAALGRSSNCVCKGFLLWGNPANYAIYAEFSYFLNLVLSWLIIKLSSSGSL